MMLVYGRPIVLLPRADSALHIIVQLPVPDNVVLQGKDDRELVNSYELCPLFLHLTHG
jgi:hypothetical protein